MKLQITEYKTLLNDKRLEELVEEKAFEYSKEKTLSSPDKIVTMMNNVFDADRLPEEHCWILGFDTKEVLKGVILLSHGTVNQALVTCRELGIKLLLMNAVSFVLIHNHPSGFCDYSSADLAVTKKVSALGSLIDCKMIDSIIIGKENYFSFLEHGLMPQNPNIEKIANVFI